MDRARWVQAFAALAGACGAVVLGAEGLLSYGPPAPEHQTQVLELLISRYDDRAEVRALGSPDQLDVGHWESVFPVDTAWRIDRSEAEPYGDVWIAPVLLDGQPVLAIEVGGGCCPWTVTGVESQEFAEGLVGLGQSDYLITYFLRDLWLVASGDTVTPLTAADAAYVGSDRLTTAEFGDFMSAERRFVARTNLVILSPILALIACSAAVLAALSLGLVAWLRRRS